MSGITALTGEQLAAAKKFASDLGVPEHIHPTDFIFQFLVTNPVFTTMDLAVRYYFYDGDNSVRQLTALMAELGKSPTDKPSLLEFASGYGCLTRHFEKYLPGARTASCDIHSEAINFIEKSFGQRAIVSNAQPELLAVNEEFDFVFALSFFSHMPRSTWSRWLVSLYSRVAPGGALIFTTQGLKTGREYMGNPEIPADGFWFKAESEQKDLDTAEYGQTVVTREFVSSQIRLLDKAELYKYSESYWWSHQDLYVVRKSI
jgi:Methyltransferase domain